MKIILYIFFGQYSFKYIDELVQHRSHNTEYYYAKHNPVELEYLASIYDKIAKPFIRRKKFSDNDTDKWKPHIDLHGI